MVLGAVAFSHEPRVGAFVEALLILEADGERLYRALHLRGHDPDYRAGVDSAAEERAEGYVRHEPPLDRAFELRSQLGGGGLEGNVEMPVPVEARYRRLPVLLDSQLSARLEC